MGQVSIYMPWYGFLTTMAVISCFTALGFLKTLAGQVVGLSLPAVRQACHWNMARH